MSQNERDTHFAGFAKLLRDAISDLAVAHHEGKLGNPRDLDEYERLVHLLIAQRAYDLVEHAMTDLINKHDGDIELFDVAGQGAEFAACVPDLTEWPNEPLEPTQ